MDQRRRDLDPARAACASRSCAAPPRAASASMSLPGNKEFLEGDEIPKPDARRRPRLRGRPGRRRRGRIPLRPVAGRSILDLFLDDLELPELAKRQLARHGEPGLAPGGLLGQRLARQPVAHPHHAQQPVAPHRAEAPEAATSCRRSRRRSPALEREGGDERAARRAARASWPERAAARPAHPLYRSDRLRYRRFEPYPEAGGAGGHVLPDGRVRLHDRAHEGSRQALLRPALHLPEAPLPPRRDRLHPPHPRGRARWTRRPSSTARRPAARWCPRRSRRWPGSSPHRYPPGGLEHLRRAGLGRRQHLQRQRDDGGAAARIRSCRSASTSPISRSAARRTAAPASCVSQSDLWRTYEAVRDAEDGVRHAARSATAATSTRSSASCSRARRGRRGGRPA